MTHIHISAHPVLQHKLALLRDQATQPPLFRGLVRELAALLAHEATTDLPLKRATIQTPLGQAEGALIEPRIALVPVLRAGLGMADGVLQLLPQAEVRHLGLYRDEESLQPVAYYDKLPDEPTADLALVLDPMLATGGSLIATVERLKRWGIARIKVLALIAARPGLDALRAAHPDVPIYLAGLDERLNDVGFIDPGLGDAGDRQFWT